MRDIPAQPPAAAPAYEEPAVDPRAAQAGKVLRRATLPDGRIDIKALDRAALRLALAGLTEEDKLDLRVRQVFTQLWKNGVTNFADLVRVDGGFRQTLAEKGALTGLQLQARIDSDDGSRKYLWKLSTGETIESVLIPDEDRPGPNPDRLTLCISTQVGCAMACAFCLTGDLGLKRNLSVSEITNQPLLVQRDLGPDKRITNLVMMGMGEPLHNYDNLTAALRILLDNEGMAFSHRRVTVSTVGLVPALKRLADESPVNLAISLNASTEEQRRRVMPITLRYSMEELMETCRTLPIPTGKRITFEYVMMAGFNDSDDDAARVFALMQGVKAKVNLIPYNENPDRDIRRPSDDRVKAFQHYLVSRGLQCSIRTTRGRDISAACGQLGKAAELMARRLGAPIAPPA
jgi:23S rRNA (adenine2503-C2)-methyltransferase